MPLLMMQPKPKAEHREEMKAAIARLFAAIDEAQPEGIRYAACERSGDEGYLVLLELSDGIENPLPALPEFTEFQAKAAEWLDESSPPPTPLTVVGNYRVFDQPAAV